MSAVDPLDPVVAASATVAPEPVPAPPAEPPVPPSSEAVTAQPGEQNCTELNTSAPFFPPSLTRDPRQLPLSSKQRTALHLLTSGKGVVSVAATLGVCRTTIYNWLKDPAFAADLRAHQLDLAQTTDLRLRKMLLHATHTAISGLRRGDPDQSFRNACRLLSTLRPWMSRLDQLLKIKENPAESEQ